MNKISVIIPVYNAEKTIMECVASIQSQQYANIEIILVNDGSKDNSLNVCNGLAMNDERIIVIDEENGGVSSARNLGIAKATGDYIAFVDADDIVESDIYTSMLSVALKKEYAMVFCNYNEYFDGVITKKIDQLSAFSECAVSSIDIIRRLMSIADDAIFGVCWRTLFKRELICKNNIEFTHGLTMAEDLQFLLKCLKETEEVGICPNYLYNFRVSNQSTTGKYMKKQDEDMRYVNNWMMEYAKNFPNAEELIENVKICMANTLVLNIANVCKVGTPYNLFQRFGYASIKVSDKVYRDAVYTALQHKEIVVGKRYMQMQMIKRRMTWVNVMFHSLKNRTLKK